jgi:hypothetical protein
MATVMSEMACVMKLMTVRMSEFPMPHPAGWRS